jgi:ABC-type sugar transport system substrate-binding protein
MMSEQFECPSDKNDVLEDMFLRSLTRAEVLRRMTAATVAVAGASLLPPWLARADAAGSSGVPYKHYSQFKPFNPKVPAGPPTGLPKVIATNFPAGSAFFTEITKNVKLAAEDRGFSLSPTTFGSDVRKNITAINQLFIKGIGALVIQPQDVAGEKDTLINAITQKGICVLYFVNGPSTIQIATSQYKVGYNQGVSAAMWVKEHLGGKAQAVVFDNSRISPSLTPRTEGRLAGLKTGGAGVQLVAKQPIKLLTPGEGSTLSATLLQAHPGINVWLGDDDTIIGVMATLQAAGKKASDPIYLSGVNGQANALAAVKQGTLFRSDWAFPNARFEYAAGQLCCDYIEGKSVPQMMLVNPIEITQQNVAKFAAENHNPKAAYASSAYASGGAGIYYGNISYQNHLSNYVINAIGP